jgi:hypothetical protein
MTKAMNLRAEILAITGDDPRAPIMTDAILKLVEELGLEVIGAPVHIKKDEYIELVAAGIAVSRAYQRQKLYEALQGGSEVTQ